MLKGMSDSEKLTYLFNTFGRGMYYVAKQLLNDSHISEDVVQEVMLRISREDILKKLENMDEKAVKYYLYTAARNLATNMYQKRKREAGVTIGSYNEEMVNNNNFSESQ
ncbi:MAG: RNA polymerase sigma factor [Acetivibrio ethanolgignens]